MASFTLTYFFEQMHKLTIRSALAHKTQNKPQPNTGLCVKDAIEKNKTKVIMIPKLLRYFDVVFEGFPISPLHHL